MKLTLHTKTLKTLSNRHRLAILSVIAASPVEISVREIRAKLKKNYRVALSQPTLSQAMRKLLDGKLVQVRREDKAMFYRLNVSRNTLNDLAAVLADLEHAHV